MPDQRGDAEGLKSKGRILGLRMGINPNSSGYGILWGGILFLPPALIGSLVSTIVETQLDRALRAHREGETPYEHKREWAVPVLWGLAWTGFFAGWLWLLMSEPFDYRMGLLGGASILATALIVHLVWRCRKHLPLKKVTWYSAIAIAIASGLGWIIASLAALELLVLIPASLTLLALVLTPMTAKLGMQRPVRWPRLVIGIIYIAVGLVLLVAFPYPSVTDGFNPIGLGFFLWGWGTPPLLTIWGLTRLKGRCGENTENPV